MKPIDSECVRMFDYVYLHMHVPTTTQFVCIIFGNYSSSDCVCDVTMFWCSGADVMALGKDRC